VVISLLCPSRGRPQNLWRLSESAFSLAASPPDIELLAYVDFDDPALPQYAALDCAEIHTGERIMFTDYWNKLAEVARGDIMGMMGDDVVFRTPGWDVMVEDEFAKWPDRIVFVNGRDGAHGPALGTHGFLHRRWVDAVGRFCPPYFSHDYPDLWLTEVADALGRRVFLPELFTEHLHPNLGKAPDDDTYREGVARGVRDNCPQLYIDTLPEREQEIATLRAVIASHG
jgi:hypothetical protein